MIHASHYAPRIYPLGGTGASAEIDRLQELSATSSLSRDKINEIGRSGVVGYRKGIPQVSLTARQLEYGSFEFWRKITNKADSVDKIDLDDFATPTFDIAGFTTDDDETFLSTIWYPELRTSGFSLSIGDPDAQIERSFTFVGEQEQAFTSNNKYLIYLEATGSSASSFQVVIGSGGFSTYPDPVVLPDSSGASYVLRVVRVRSGVMTELVEGTNFVYDSGTTMFTFYNNTVGDLYKITYTASTYISGVSAFTDNDVDETVITADQCSIYLRTSDYLYRLQSVNIDVSLERKDVKEIGNNQVVSRGVSTKTVNVTLGKILEDYTTDEVLRGVAADYGQYNIQEFKDDISLIIKIYDTNAKDNFVIGYRMDNLTPSSIEGGVPVNDYVTKNTTLTGEEMIIANNEIDLLA
jgi:hypothetical protein